MIYLDNAATSFPKPACVSAEVSRCIRDYCGNPGRGFNPLAMAAAEKIYECRAALADFFRAPDPSRVIFMPNCTAALNVAIKGLLHSGDHVLVSDMEHNSVRRPLERLKSEGTIDYSQFSLSRVCKISRFDAFCAELEKHLRPETSALICTAASNVCSLTAPLYRLGRFCRKHQLLFIVDAAQGAGHFGIYMDRFHISALCLPSHKGLMGIQGAGALILANGILPAPLLEGGSGSLSLDPFMPEELPERYEAGTLPTPAIVSMTEGLSFIKQTGLDRISAAERSLFAYCREILQSFPGARVYAPDAPGSVLSFNVSGFSADTLANSLGRAGICVRGGYHCAPWAHHALGTDRSADASGEVAPDGFSGTVRVSFSPFNTPSDIDALAAALSVICK